jgi:hypothetical protein
MLTKQTILTQTGSGIKTSGIILPGEQPAGEPICGDLHAVKQRSAGTAEEAEDQRYQETTQSGYRKSQWAKQPPRRICRGTREVPKYLQGISVSTEKQKDALHKHELL